MLIPLPYGETSDTGGYHQTGRRVIWITDLPYPERLLLKYMVTLDEALTRILDSTVKRIGIWHHADAMISMLQAFQQGA